MLSGKIALVTGGSRGLGREIALTMARQGADIAIVYNASDAAAQQVQQEIEAMGRGAAFISVMWRILTPPRP